MTTEPDSHPARGVLLHVLMSTETMPLAQAEQLADALLAALDNEDFEVVKRHRFQPWEEGFSWPREFGV